MILRKEGIIRASTGGIIKKDTRGILGMDRSSLYRKMKARGIKMQNHYIV